METDKLIEALAKYADSEVIPHLSDGRRWAVAGAMGAAGAFIKAKAGDKIAIDKGMLKIFFDSAFKAESKVTINPKNMLRQLISSDTGPVFDLIANPLDIELTFDIESAEKFLSYLP